MTYSQRQLVGAYSEIPKPARSSHSRLTKRTKSMSHPIQQDLLRQMEHILNNDGINYTTFLRIYAIHCCTGVGVEQLAKEALGQAVVIGNIKDVSASDIESDLRACLGYAGDAGAGPGAGVIFSDEFCLLLEKICEDMKIQSERSLSLKSFRIEEGHPAYPVFWDFAFAFLQEGEGKILICSSSD